MLLPPPVCGGVQGGCRGFRAAWTLNHFQRVNELKCIMLPGRRRCSALLLTSASSNAATLLLQPPWLNGGRHLRLYDFLLLQRNSFALGGNCSFFAGRESCSLPNRCTPPHLAAVLKDSFYSLLMTCKYRGECGTNPQMAACLESAFPQEFWSLARNAG